MYHYGRDMVNIENRWSLVNKVLYHQRNKDETIISVIKRLFEEHVTSSPVKTQDRELSFRCIAYNMHRLTSLMIVLMVSTEPLQSIERILFYVNMQIALVDNFTAQQLMSTYIYWQICCSWILCHYAVDIQILTIKKKCLTV